MSELTSALLGIGLAIIALVVTFNWWQERKIKKIIIQNASEIHEDLLMETPETLDIGTTVPTEDQFDDPFTIGEEVDFKIQIEETLENQHDLPPTDHYEFVESKDSEVLSTYEDELDEPVVQNELIQESNQNDHAEVIDFLTKRSIHAPDAMNEEVDLIAHFHFSDPVKFESFSQNVEIFNRLDKPVLSFGLDENNHWHALGHASQSLELTEAAFSLQLADRAGAVTEETLSQFQQLITEMALKFNVEPTWIGVKDVLAYAQSLDEFCLEVDKTMHLHLVSGPAGRFTGTKFRGLAEANGLTLNPNGEYQSLSPLGQVNFTLVNIENNPLTNDMLKSSLLKGVTFSLDIPRADHCAEAFNQMLLIAKKMEQALSASLIDDRQKELSDHQIEKIRQQLKLIQTHMTTRGIPSGSPVALRLFS
jgi:hypothetical protein